MSMKRKSVYANMTASDLARITRERGLDKPNVITLSEWADFLEADDIKRREAEQANQGIAEGDGEGHVLPELTDENADKQKTFDLGAKDQSPAPPVTDTKTPGKKDK